MRKHQKLIFIVMIMSLVFSLVGCESSIVVDGEMQVYFFDVGQGESIYIKSPNGENILIDAGEKKYGDIVVENLKQLGVDTIDVMIATHPHADHIGGLITVLNNLEVKSVYTPRVTHTTKTYEEFVLAAKSQDLKFTEAKAGVDLGIYELDAKFVGPVNTYSDNLNNWSAVLKVKYGDTSFLFTGDAEGQSETDMVSSNQDIRATVLKLGHHGSNTSSSDAFLDKVNPKYAVASAGVDNKYGHPTPEIVDKINNLGIELYRTDLQGTIVATSNGTDVTFSVDRSY